MAKFWFVFWLVIANLAFALAAPEPAQAQASAQTPAQAAEAYRARHQSHVGLYEVDGEFLIIGMFATDGALFFERIGTGDVRTMTPGSDGDQYHYGPRVSAGADVEGRLRFSDLRDGLFQSLTWTDETGQTRTARRPRAHVETVSFANGDAVTLGGTLIIPDSPRPGPAVVLVTQSDRYDIWDVGMWLLSRGVAVLAYDRRNTTSASVGPPIPGPYPDRQLVHARDAEAAVRYLRTRAEIDPEKIGVVGWSGGGFMAAQVAAADPRLAFFVNMAGDASVGFQQASHSIASRLYREGYSDAEVEAGRAFIQMHFGVNEGRTPWDEYQAAITRVSDTAWYKFLSGRYGFPHESLEKALADGAYQAQWTPERIYGSVSHTPTLGVYFEYDQSSAPESPANFQRALHGAGNRDYAVAVFPDAHHGGFVLNGAGYRFDHGTLPGRSPVMIDFVADWVERRVMQ